jgi:glutamate--glyoxylate aminotransferase
MGEPYASRVELFSFHTVSKGALGECGLRGGYFEALNIHPDSIAQLYKLASINLCPNVFGQIAVSLMVNEPKPGQPSYERFIEQKMGTLASYRCALLRQGTNRKGHALLSRHF